MQVGLGISISAKSRDTGGTAPGSITWDNGVTWDNGITWS